MEIALSAACCAAGQESDFQAGALVDLLEFPAEVDVELPELPLALSEELPTPEEAAPVLLAREELVPVVRVFVLLGLEIDWPAPGPVPLELPV